MGLVPEALQHKPLAALLNRVFSQAISEGDLDFLIDHWLKIELRDIGHSLLISLVNQQLCLAPSPNAPKADVVFSGEVNDFILIAARKEDPDALFFQRRLLITGDTELGLELKNLLDSLDLSALPSLLRYPLLDAAHLVALGRRAPEPDTGATAPRS
ncbi:MAG: ubiquinone anaerobic biosynthesis accessory factor UbiT [Aeromonas sp.]